MAFEGMDALSRHYVPNLGSVVKGRGHELVSVSVKVEADDLSFVACEVKQFFSMLNVPKLGSVVHRASGYQQPMGVEA